MNSTLTTLLTHEKYYSDGEVVLESARDTYYTTDQVLAALEGCTGMLLHGHGGNTHFGVQQVLGNDDSALVTSAGEQEMVLAPLEGATAMISPVEDKAGNHIGYVLSVTHDYIMESLPDMGEWTVAFLLSCKGYSSLSAFDTGNVYGGVGVNLPQATIDDFCRSLKMR